MRKRNKNYDSMAHFLPKCLKILQKFGNTPTAFVLFRFIFLGIQSFLPNPHVQGILIILGSVTWQMVMAVSVWMSIVILERDFTLCLRHAEEDTVSLFKHGEKLLPTVSLKDPVLPAKSSLLQKHVTAPKVHRKRLNSADCICATQPIKLCWVGIAP